MSDHGFTRIPETVETPEVEEGDIEQGRLKYEGVTTFMNVGNLGFTSKQVPHGLFLTDIQGRAFNVVRDPTGTKADTYFHFKCAQGIVQISMTPIRVFIFKGGNYTVMGAVRDALGAQPGLTSNSVWFGAYGFGSVDVVILCRMRLFRGSDHSELIFS